MNHFDQDWRRVQTTKNLNFSQGIPFFKSQKKLNNDNKLATKLEGFKKSYGIGKFAKEAFIKKNGKNNDNDKKYISREVSVKKNDEDKKQRKEYGDFDYGYSKIKNSNSNQKPNKKSSIGKLQKNYKSGSLKFYNNNSKFNFSYETNSNKMSKGTRKLQKTLSKNQDDKKHKLMIHTSFEEEQKGIFIKGQLINYLETISTRIFSNGNISFANSQTNHPNIETTEQNLNFNIYSKKNL